MDWGLLEIIVVVAIAVVSAVGGLVGRAIRSNSRRIDDLNEAHAGHVAQLRAEAQAQVREIEVQLETKVEAHDRQIAALIAAQITHDDLGRIYERINAVDSSVSKLGGEVQAMHGTLKTVVQHLIEK